jgi:hypothetical protein
LIANIITAAASILAVLGIYLQVQKGHASTLRAQEAHLRNQLKVDVYERVSKVFHDCAERVSAASGLAQSALFALHWADKGMPGTHPATSKALQEAHFEAVKSISKLQIALEQYEIAFARFGSIRRAIGETIKELFDKHSQLWPKFLLLVPTQDSTTGIISPPAFKPTDANVAEIEQAYQEYRYVCDNLQGYLLDLQIEAQNELLGDLFQRELPPRNPMDSSIKVLRRDASAPTTREPGRFV